MEKMPEKTPLELAFDSVVFQCGGHLVSQLHPYCERRRRGSPPQDADYFFPSHQVLAELKRLKEDTFAPIDDPRIQAMSASWVKKGLIHPPRPNRWRWNVRELPPLCQREAINFFEDPVRRVVNKANGQIKDSKILLGLPDSTKGLFLVASDGNTVCDPESVVTLLARTFKRPFYSSVHSLIYFNYSVFADSPALGADVLFWIPCAIRDGGVSPSLLASLERRWSDLLAVRFSRSFRRLQNPDSSLLADLQFHRK